MIGRLVVWTCAGLTAAPFYGFDFIDHLGHTNCIHCLKNLNPLVEVSISKHEVKKPGFRKNRRKIGNDIQAC